MRGKSAQKNWSDIQFGAEKITFPPKTDGQTDRRTDICFYRVALLLLIKKILWYRILKKET